MPDTLLIAGVDEVGRGPLAGPVVAAAVILDPAHPISGLADSKQLSPARRERLALEIRAHALAWALGRAEVAGGLGAGGTRCSSARVPLAPTLAPNPIKSSAIHEE